MSSDAFYALMAPAYDVEFLAPHRATYDRMAFEAVTALFGGDRAIERLSIVDIGCGTGRWSRLFVQAGHDVIGIEPCAEMAAATRSLDGDRFQLVASNVDEASIETGWADLVIAMGSIQYAPDPAASIERAATWLAPGGAMAVLVDSFGGLVLELLARNDRTQAAERAVGRRAQWTRNEVDVGYHLFDAAELERVMIDSGLDDVRVQGLLVSHSVVNRAELGFEGSDLDVERVLAATPALADSAKQLLAIGRKRGP